MIVATRQTGVMFLTLALACCAPEGSGGPPTADQAARAACRQQAEQSFDVRNRASRYTPEYGRDAPLSGQASPQIDRGLAVNISNGLDANLNWLKHKIIGMRCLRPLCTT